MKEWGWGVQLGTLVYHCYHPKYNLSILSLLPIYTSEALDNSGDGGFSQELCHINATDQNTTFQPLDWGDVKPPR